jgi:hypothetical protein
MPEFLNAIRRFVTADQKDTAPVHSFEGFQQRHDVPLGVYRHLLLALYTRLVSTSDGKWLAAAVRHSRRRVETLPMMGVQRDQIRDPSPLSRQRKIHREHERIAGKNIPCAPQGQ